MIRTLYFIAAALVLLSPFGGATPAFAQDIMPGVEIVLPASATSQGLEIAVEHIAQVKSDDKSLADRVRTASLGYAPAPGFHRTLRADLIQASLNQSLPGIRIKVTGATRCRVSPAVTVVSGKTLRAKAAQAVRTELSGVDAEAIPEGEVSDIQVPQGDGEPRLVAKALSGIALSRDVPPGLRNVPVEIWVGDKLYRTVRVQFRVSIWRRTAVLRQGVNVGDALHAGLFEEKRIPIGEPRDLQALPLNKLAGAIALKPLPKGALVMERDVHREVVMERGSQVTVQVRKGAVIVTDVGVCVTDGKLGERVRVTLSSTGAELNAVVKGRRLVEVNIQ